MKAKRLLRPGPCVFGSLAIMMILCASSGNAAPQGRTQAQAKAQKYPKLPDDVERRSVTIWSDGARMAGDIYQPKDVEEGQKLPVIVFIHGTGGVKKMGWSCRIANHFAQSGYLFLNFDYRGWGESDSKLQMLEAMPNPDENNEITVKARAIRWQMDFADQVADIRNAIAFMSGEKNADYSRIGILGTSYGGGLVTYVAGHDPRVKASAAQVPGMGGGRGRQFEYHQYVQQTQRARGDIEPVPFKTGAPGGKMSSYAHMRYNIAKGIGYDVFEAAGRIKTPMLIIDAGKEELMDITKNGGKVAGILKANGVPVTYHIYEDINHYGIYGKRLVDAAKMEIKFFDEHLKPKKEN